MYDKKIYLIKCNLNVTVDIVFQLKLNIFQIIKNLMGVGFEPTPRMTTMRIPP